MMQLESFLIACKGVYLCICLDARERDLGGRGEREFLSVCREGTLHCHLKGLGLLRDTYIHSIYRLDIHVYIH